MEFSAFAKELEKDPKIKKQLDRGRKEYQKLSPDEKRAMLHAFINVEEIIK